MKKIFWIIIIVVLFVVLFFISINKFSITGDWVIKWDKSYFEYSFNEDGTFIKNEIPNNKIIKGEYKFDKKKKSLILTSDDYIEDYEIVKYEGDCFIVHSKTTEEDDVFCRYRDEIKLYDRACLNPDKDGFCIKDGELIAYVGNKSKVKIPSNVHTIKSNAFAGDMDRAPRISTVIIPGNVKTIEGSAFSFSGVSTVYLEEGVESIGRYAFMESCVYEIHIPNSVNSIGSKIFDGEEMCGGTLKVYTPKGSYADSYMKSHKPYYKKKSIIYE